MMVAYFYSHPIRINKSGITSEYFWAAFSFFTRYRNNLDNMELFQTSSKVPPHVLTGSTRLVLTLLGTHKCQDLVSISQSHYLFRCIRMCRSRSRIRLSFKIVHRKEMGDKLCTNTFVSFHVFQSDSILQYYSCLISSSCQTRQSR